MKFTEEELKIIDWVLDAEVKAFDIHFANSRHSVAADEHYKKVVALKRRFQTERGK